MTHDEYMAFLPNIIADWREYRTWKDAELPGSPTTFEGFMNYLSLRDKKLIKITPIEEREA